MGFSVSGAAALIFVALLISFGTFYGATMSSFDQIQDAQVDQTDRAIETINTEVEITVAEYDPDERELTIEVDNTGASTVELSATDLLIDGEYRQNWRDTATIDGDADSSLWMPQQTVTITLDFTEQPDQIKVVTKFAIADTTEVEESN